jgi:hypothetical protein
MNSSPTATATSSQEDVAAARRRIRASNLDRTCLAMGFADLYKTDAQAELAAQQSAKKAGEPKPQGIIETFSANFLSVRGHLWIETKVGERRFRSACWQAAQDGAKAYITGEEGNGYTEFLTRRFGFYSNHQAPFRFVHWWFDKGWENSWLWFFAIIGGIIALLPFLDNDLRPALQKAGISGLWEGSKVGEWSRTSLLFGAPLAVLLAHMLLENFIGGSTLFAKEKALAKKKHEDDWVKVGVFRIHSEIRTLESIGKQSRFVTWYGGSGERFGPKEFWAECSSDASPLDLLGTVASALSQSPLTQAWRITPQIRHGAKAREPNDSLKTSVFNGHIYATELERVGFVATGSYSWDDQSFLARTADGVAIMGDISQMRGGKSDVHLECMAITTSEAEKCYLRFRFSERMYPMWLRRQAEALVALSVQVLRDRLDMEGIASKWAFSIGDWATYQLLRLPNQTGIELQPSSSLDVLEPIKEI